MIIGSTLSNMSPTTMTMVIIDIVINEIRHVMKNQPIQ